MMNILLTALAPIFWGTTYLVTTELLPEGRPLLAGALRALPVGLWIVISYRKLPQGVWWWRMFVLGTLNIGLFFVLLFVAAYRLPGGVAATLGAIQPLIVAGLAWVLLAQRPRFITLLAGVVGIIGVALLVLAPGVALDVWGVVAALAGAVSMATGVVLAKRWVRPVPVLLFTGWQLLVGGLLVAVLSLLIEGLPPQFTMTNVLGFSYLGVVGTGLAYTLWFRGIERIGVSVSFLGLLSPLVATLVGYVVLEQHLSRWQLVGGTLILVSVVVGNWQGQKRQGRKLQHIQSEPVTGTVPQPVCN
ncbi:MAG: EamA family transporter [Deinococcota bacterium]